MVASSDCPSTTTWALWLVFRILLSEMYRTALRLKDRSGTQGATRTLGTGSRVERAFRKLRKR